MTKKKNPQMDSQQEFSIFCLEYANKSLVLKKSFYWSIFLTIFYNNFTCTELEKKGEQFISDVHVGLMRTCPP